MLLLLMMDWPWLLDLLWQRWLMMMRSFKAYSLLSVDVTSVVHHVAAVPTRSVVPLLLLLFGHLSLLSFSLSRPFGEGKLSLLVSQFVL